MRYVLPALIFATLATSPADANGPGTIYQQHYFPPLDTAGATSPQDHAIVRQILELRVEIQKLGSDRVHDNSEQIQALLSQEEAAETALNGQEQNEKLAAQAQQGEQQQKFAEANAARIDALNEERAKEQAENPYHGKQHWVRVGVTDTDEIIEVDLSTITRIDPGANQVLPPNYRAVDASTSGGETYILFDCANHRYGTPNPVTHAFHVLQHIPEGSFGERMEALVCNGVSD